MNKKQTFLIFVAFFFALFVLTMPLWLDTAIPYLNSYMRAVTDTAGRWIAVLKKLI